MKKMLLAFILCISLCGCQPKNEDGFVSIDVQDVLTKISNKDTFLIIINNSSSSDDCYSCNEFENEIKDTVEKHNLTVYTLNCYDIGEVDMDQLNIALGKYSTWPVAFYVVEGEISQINKYEYSLNPEGWQTWLKDMKIISD